MNQPDKRGFTLIEMMIVVALIALLAVIALPNMIRARENTQRTTCLYNRRLIHDVISQWALAESKASDDVIVASALGEYAKTGDLPRCPSGNAQYEISGTVGDPVISCPSHPDDDVPEEEEEP